MRIGRATYDGTVCYGRVDGNLFHVYEEPTLADLLGGQRPHERRVVPLNQVTLHAPVPQPGKLVCIGLNYHDHCEELGVPVPVRPVIFAKFTSSIADPFTTILRPPETRQLDYEAELAVIIGKPGHDIPVAEARQHVFGYTIFNDISARDLQFADSQWIRSKSFPTFGPMGPWITTAEEVPDPQSLAIKLRPAGVGGFRNPPIYLQPDDLISIEIEGLGRLENRIAEAGTAALNPRFALAPSP